MESSFNMHKTSDPREPSSSDAATTQLSIRVPFNRQATVIRIDNNSAAAGGGRKISTSVRKISCNVASRKISFVMGPHPTYRGALSTSPPVAGPNLNNNNDEVEDDQTTSTTVLNIVDDSSNGSGDDDNHKSVEYSVDALGDYTPQIRQQRKISTTVRTNNSGVAYNRAKSKLSVTTATDTTTYFPYNSPQISSFATNSCTAQETPSFPYKAERPSVMPNELAIEEATTDNDDDLQSAEHLYGVGRRPSLVPTDEQYQHKTSKVLFKISFGSSNAATANDAEEGEKILPKDSVPNVLAPGYSSSAIHSAPTPATHTKQRNNASRIRSISYAFQYGTDWQTTADDDDQAEENRKSSSFFYRLRRMFFSPTVTRPYSSTKLHKNQKASLSEKCERLCRSFGAAVGGEEWLFLLVLGIIMACLSYVIDMVSDNILTTRLKLYDKAGSIPLKLFIWLSFPLTLVTLATVLTNKCAPQAIGSGIPEMKTILHGVILKDYLSIPTLLTKYFGLMLMLSSGLPIGKVGPFVHIGSMVARQLNRLRAYMISRRLNRVARRRQSTAPEPLDDSTSGVFQTSRSMLVETAGKYETLAAGCATGVAAAMAAPIGGVLFSIEATSVYFAVKNYWRGFFAAVCAALTFLLLGVLMKKQVTILPVIQTKFPIDFPFDPVELLMFALVGVVCGAAGAVFVKLHRQVVMTQRKYVPRRIVPYFVYAYPLCFATLYFLVTFPDGIGHYMAGRLSPRKAMVAFFSDSDMTEHFKTPQQKLRDSLQQNITTARQQLLQQLNDTLGTSSIAYRPNQTTTTTPTSRQVVHYVYGGGGDETGYLLSPELSAAAHYGFEDDEKVDDIRHFVADRAPELSIILIVANYVVFHYFATPISISLPTPVGVFMPTIGRLMGEITAHFFPNGIADPDIAGGVRPILPGAYAVVGAAAFSGAVTQTISTSVIAAEMTGQMAHILPVLVATLIANYIARRVGELSIFDSIIRLKRLPYLPQLDVLSESVHRLKAGDIMMRAVKFVTLCDTYVDVRRVLSEAPPSIRVLPLVDSPETMVLVGAIARRDLDECVAQQMNFRRYLVHLDKIQTRNMRRPTAPEVFDKLLLAKQESEYNKVLTDDVDEAFLAPVKKSAAVRRRPKASSAGKLSLTRMKTVPPTLTEEQHLESAEAVSKDQPAQSQTAEKLFRTGSLSNFTPSSSSSSTSEDEDDDEEPTHLLLPSSSSNEKPSVITPKTRFTVSSVDEPRTANSPPPLSMAQIERIWLPPPDVGGGTSHKSSTSEPSPKSTTVNLLEQSDKDGHNNVASFPAHDKNKRACSSPVVYQAEGGQKLSANSVQNTVVTANTPSAVIKDHVLSRLEWEQQMLEQPCNFDNCSVDVSPMQVVENMSISKLHRLFSLLGLQTVYATSLGRLVGVITVGDLRRALQEAGK